MQHKPSQELHNEHTQEDSGNGGDILEQTQREVAESQPPRYRILRRTRVLIGIYSLLFVLFGLLAWFVNVNPILAIDVQITREFQENQAPWLVVLMSAVSFPGDHLLLTMSLIGLTALAFWLVRLRLEAVVLIAHTTVSALLNSTIKYIVNRPRPNASLVTIFEYASGKSFPSGHVMSYVAFWGLLFSFSLILLKRDRWWHYVVLIVPAVMVILVGPSRIYLGDHWASDVLGGYLLGGLLLSISLWLYLHLRKRFVRS